MNEYDKAHFFTTEQLGDLIGIKPVSIRVRLCQTGSYFGLIPSKLPNGRLLWPADSVERLLMTKEGAA